MLVYLLQEIRLSSGMIGSVRLDLANTAPPGDTFRQQVRSTNPANTKVRLGKTVRYKSAQE